MHDDAMKNVASRLEGILGVMLAPGRNTQPVSVNCQHIVGEAAKLVASMRSQRAQYFFSTPPMSEGAKDLGILIEERWPDFSVVNVDTGKTIRNIESVQVAADGWIGRALCAISPALCRRGQDGSGKVLLKKARILVKFDLPLPKSNKRRADTVQDREGRRARRV